MDRRERSSASLERLPHLPGSALERRQIAVVIDDVIALRPFPGGGKLRRHHPVSLDRREPPSREQPGPPQRLGRIHQHHGVERPWIVGLEEQGDIADHDAIAPDAGLIEQLQPPAAHFGVDDLVEIGEGCRVSHDPRSQRRTVQTPILQDYIRPEACGDLSQDRLAGCLGLTHQPIGIDYGGPPLLEQSSNGGFASPDVTRQGYGKHPERLGIKEQTSRGAGGKETWSSAGLFASALVLSQGWNVSSCLQPNFAILETDASQGIGTELRLTARAVPFGLRLYGEPYDSADTAPDSSRDRRS